MRLVVLSAGLSILVLAGCASEPGLVGRPDMTVVEGNQLPPPTAKDALADPRPYLIGPFDSISIEVFGISELNRAAQVDSNGRISMPLIGSLQAAGKTPEELARLVEERMRTNHILDPQVTVNLTGSLSQTVTVDGQVKHAGIYPIQGRMTLMRSVARAEGLGDDAREDYVVVFRRVGDKDMAALYDLRAIRSGTYPDPDIYANDVVYVGFTNARRVFGTIVSGVAILTAPLVTVLNK
jgi:polysaccharide export outer membrane protein